jgi:hypothetical protein
MRQKQPAPLPEQLEAVEARPDARLSRVPVVLRMGSERPGLANSGSEFCTLAEEPTTPRALRMCPKENTFAPATTITSFEDDPILECGPPWKRTHLKRRSIRKLSSTLKLRLRRS